MLGGCPPEADDSESVCEAREPPEDGGGGSVGLSGAVAATDCNTAVVADGADDLCLRALEEDFEPVAKEADGPPKADKVGEPHRAMLLDCRRSSSRSRIWSR